MIRLLRRAAVAPILLSVACGGPEPERARHVVLVTLDTVRADRLGCYGRANAGTPWLDALAARGTRADRVYASVPLTLPSHLSILTGLEPPRTGIRDNGDLTLAPGVRTLTERLAERGYHTAAAVGGFPVARRFPASRGFERFDDQFSDPRNPAGLERDAGEVVRAAVSVASSRGDRPLFLWVHFFDPHDPYEPVEPWRSRFLDDPYQGEISRVDSALADLERGLRGVVGEETVLWVIVADHGESLGEHGEDTHGFFLYEPTVRVPLLLAGPGVGRGAILPDPLASVDVAPTILELLGLPVPAGLDGVPIRGHSPGRRIYLETVLPARHYGWSALHGAVSGWTKYIAAPRAEMYDLRSDPGESDNLVDERAEDAAELSNWVRGNAGHSVAPVAASPDPRLASLGYVRSAERAGATGAAEDPKDRIGTYRDFQRVARLLEAGRPQEALPLIDALLRSGGTSGVRFQRARALRMAGRLSEASAVLKELGDFPGAAMERTRIAVIRGDGPAALREVERHLATAPGDAEAIMLRGAAKELLGDVDGAEGDYRSAVRTNPAFGGASLRLIRLVVLGGRLEEARSLLSAHLERHPDDTLARGLLAEL